jgi:hypothetical protein
MLIMLKSQVLLVMKLELLLTHLWSEVPKLNLKVKKVKQKLLLEKKKNRKKKSRNLKSQLSLRMTI